MGYNFIDQQTVSSCLIQGYTDDSFYYPTTNQHTGFAIDGNYYLQGVLQPDHAKASWFTEFGTNDFRGSTAAFPTYAIALLSTASLVILDQSKAVSRAENLPLWMQFILGDNNALTNNFNGALQSFSPTSVCYADGIISVTYSPDAGNQAYNVPATVTATSITADVLTVTAVNSYSAGQLVFLRNTQESFLNNQLLTITTASASDFTADFSHADFSNPSDSGSVVLPLVPNYPAPYPNVPVQSHMIVSIDFVQDSVYLDVSV